MSGSPQDLYFTFNDTEKPVFLFAFPTVGVKASTKETLSKLRLLMGLKCKICVWAWDQPRKAQRSHGASLHPWKHPHLGISRSSATSKIPVSSSSSRSHVQDRTSYCHHCLLTDTKLHFFKIAWPQTVQVAQAVKCPTLRFRLRLGSQSRGPCLRFSLSELCLLPFLKIFS